MLGLSFTRRRYGKYAKYGAGLAASVAQNWKSGRSYTRTMTKKPKARSGVTHTRDNIVQYRKRRMPRRKRKQWAGFVKKVAAANERSLGTKTLVFNASYSVAPVGSATQGFMIASLYGVNGSNSTQELGSQDLYNIFQKAYLSTKENQKFTFKSAVLDMTLTNTGTTRLEVDLYHLSYWGISDFANFGNAHTEAYVDTPTMDPNVSGYFGGLELGKRGVSPFDLPALIRYAKFTIQKKIKYWIDVGETATFQIRDPRTRHIAENAVLSGVSHFANKGLTQSVLIVAKGVVGTDTGSQLTMGVTRKYSLNSVDADDQDGYVVA